MRHFMNLKIDPFRRIANGSKRYELRLYDEKRRLIRVDDEILFQCGEETLLCEVLALHRFATFGELYDSLPTVELGYDPQSVSEAKAEDMRQYYPWEAEERYGVVAIEIRLLRGSSGTASEETEG